MCRENLVVFRSMRFTPPPCFCQCTGIGTGKDGGEAGGGVYPSSGLVKLTALLRIDGQKCRTTLVRYQNDRSF